MIEVVIILLIILIAVQWYSRPVRIGRERYDADAATDASNMFTSRLANNFYDEASVFGYNRPAPE